MLDFAPLRTDAIKCLRTTNMNNAKTILCSDCCQILFTISILIKQSKAMEHVGRTKPDTISDFVPVDATNMSMRAKIYSLLNSKRARKCKRMI